MKNSKMILQKFQLDFRWPTQEPFIFCVHHLDRYPPGTSEFGPKPELLKERSLGEDFEARDGFRMYHGEVVPGFPVHPHRGFETVTIVRKGFIDHADSLGAAGRYGDGDVQWMTAGRGIQHSEMFPLLRSDQDNPTELFQLWLNLPQTRKMNPPDFKMFWNEKIPVVDLKEAKITVIAGQLGETVPIAPPQASWAHDVNTETVIWLIQIEPGGQFEIPASKQAVGRSLYFYEGDTIQLGSEKLDSKTGVFVQSQKPLLIQAGKKTAEILLLQSLPIQEPVVQYGPFVMNTEAEIHQAIADYQKTRFGGWPWPRNDMIHGSQLTRFAKYPDGHTEQPN